MTLTSSSAGFLLKHLVMAKISRRRSPRLLSLRSDAIDFRKHFLTNIKVDRKVLAMSVAADDVREMPIGRCQRLVRGHDGKSLGHAELRRRVCSDSRQRYNRTQAGPAFCRMLRRKLDTAEAGSRIVVRTVRSPITQRAPVDMPDHRPRSTRRRN